MGLLVVDALLRADGRNSDAILHLDLSCDPFLPQSPLCSRVHWWRCGTVRAQDCIEPQSTAFRVLRALFLKQLTYLVDADPES